MDYEVEVARPTGGQIKLGDCGQGLSYLTTTDESNWRRYSTKKGSE